MLDPVGIGLTEQVLVTEYRPVWNVVVDGFGHHGPGKTRRSQQRSRWDTLHPGRPWATEYREREEDREAIVEAIATHRSKT